MDLGNQTNVEMTAIAVAKPAIFQKNPHESMHTRQCWFTLIDPGFFFHETFLRSSVGASPKGRKALLVRASARRFNE